MRKYIVLSLVFVFSLFCAGMVYAHVGGHTTEIDELNTEIEQKKSKIKDIESSISSYKKLIEEKRLEGLSLENQLAILENRSEEVRLDIELTEEKLEILEIELEKLNQEIHIKAQTVEKQKKISSEILREMQKKSDRSFLEILTAYDNFSDFYSKVHELQTLEVELAQNTKNIKAAKFELEGKKTQVEQKKLAYSELQGRLLHRKKDLEEQMFAKEELLLATESSEMKYQTLVVNLKSQYRSIEEEIAKTEQLIRQKLEESKKLEKIPKSENNSKLSWPTDSRYITARFHDPDYPYRHVFEHNAIDIRAAQRTPLYASASGYVGRAKKCSTASCYSYTMIVHSNGLSTVYGHMNEIIVNEDQYVNRGDLIGYSGAAPGTVGAGPFTTGPHLHFEVRKNGIPVNPLNYLVKDW